MLHYAIVRKITSQQPGEAICPSVASLLRLGCLWEQVVVRDFEGTEIRS